MYPLHALLSAYEAHKPSVCSTFIMFMEPELAQP